MLYLNKNNLPDYLHAQSNQISVVFENGVYSSLNNVLNKISILKNSNTIWNLLIANKINETLGVPTNLVGKIFENNILVYGNGDTWKFKIEYTDFTLVIQYTLSSNSLELVGPPPKSLYQAQNLSLKEIKYIDNISFVEDLFNECLRYSTLLTEILDSITYYNHKFLPEVYYSEYPNSIPIMAEKALTKIIDDVESFKINDWTDIQTVQKEFHFESVFGANSPILKIADSSLIKGLFAIKGTETGLRFVLKYFNIEVVVFYAEDIKRLKLIEIPDRLITECDIIIDLTLGASSSLGVKPDGTIDYDYDKNFKDLITKVMSVCLNILAFTYTKRVQDSWYANHPIQGEVSTDEIETFSDTHRFLFPETAKTCGVKPDGVNNLYYPLSHYGDPIRYGQGYVYYPDINPFDFGLKFPQDCEWYSQSRLNEIVITNEITEKLCIDTTPRYGKGLIYSYDTTTRYTTPSLCNMSYGDNSGNEIEHVMNDWVLSTDKYLYTDNVLVSSVYQNSYRSDTELMYNSGFSYGNPRWSDSINVLIEEN